MNGLDLLLGKHSHLLVLRALYNADEPLSGREVERRTGLSNRAAMLALDALATLSALHVETTSRAHLYNLNRNHYLVSKAIRPAFEAEDLFWDDLRKLIRKIVHPRPIAAVATGPLARDESLASGKIEVSLFFTTGRNRIRAFHSTQELVDEVWDRYALDIESVLLDPNSMNQETHAALWRRIEREGILLFGTLP